MMDKLGILGVRNTWRKTVTARREPTMNSNFIWLESNPGHIGGM